MSRQQHCGRDFASAEAKSLRPKANSYAESTSPKAKNRHRASISLPMAFFWFFTESWGKSSLEARLRTRKVTGRDASLPAPLLSAFEMLVGRGTVGALPQTPQGTLSLDPARGRRKGTKSPLDPFSRLSWSRFHASSACSFLALRLSPCLLPQLSVKNHFSYAFTFPKLSGISTTKRGWHDKSPADTRSSGSSSAFSGYRRRKSATGAIGHDSFAAVL